MAERPLLELVGVGHRYPGPPAVEALAGLELAIAAQSFTAIVGPSGSGKSTLLNVLGLLEVPTSGRYLLNGEDTAALPERDRSRLRAHAIGFVFQSFHLIEAATGVENVELGLLYHDVRRRVRRRRAQAALDQVGLAGRADARSRELSGGERQRVAIARALVHEPDLLLCDEPTGNLDQATGQRILDDLQALHARGTTIVMITHDRAVAAAADRRIELVDGHLLPDAGPG